MDIFGAVDGTGDSNNATYSADFENSHVRKLFKTWHSPKGWYIRGPSLLGNETGQRATAIAQNVKTAWHEVARTGRQPRIFLTGYSRGGAAVVEICHQLKVENIPVYCLMLFDAVDRTHTISRTSVPDNVTNCFHAMRSPQAGSRTSFGNCAVIKDNGTTYRTRTFLCTHGGVGGTPWPDSAAGREGFIYEHDGVMAGAAAVGDAVIRSAVPLVGVFMPSPVRRSQRTNVTPTQDQAGAIESWNWMKGHFDSVKNRC